MYRIISIIKIIKHKKNNTFTILDVQSNDGAIFSNICNLGILNFSLVIIFFKIIMIGTVL